jgi:hypothetical protein
MGIVVLYQEITSSLEVVGDLVILELGLLVPVDMVEVVMEDQMTLPM